jgi:glycosyltransferase involved in cell wall biosynthesis
MESILCQTLPDWELVVCDSYSTDGAWEFLQKYRDNPRVQLTQIPREGVYAGWNECLKRARGQYVYIATSDDTAESNLLERMVGTLEQYPDVDLVVCKFGFIDEVGRPMTPPPFQEVGSFYDPWRAQPHRRTGLLEFLVHVGLDCPSWTSITSVLFRRRLIEKAGLFKTDCGTGADRLWAMKAALVTDTISIPDVLATWRQHSSQASWGKPSIKVAKRNWQMSAETLTACKDHLPLSWKSEPDWRELLLRNVRGQYYKRIGLDRETLLISGVVSPMPQSTSPDI